MARAPRPVFPGGLYQINTRGNRRCAIYRDDYDRRHWFGLLARTVKRFRWRCFAYVAMTTHYHVFVLTPEPNLSRGMEYLNGRYAKDFNGRYRLRGHLFEQRFFSNVVESEEEVFDVLRYIALNPVKAGICARPADYPWSSYQAVVGDVPAPSFLDVKWVLALFGDDPRQAAIRFAEFVAAGWPERPRPVPGT